MWKSLNSRFIENLNNAMTKLSKFGYGPLEFNSSWVRQIYLTKLVGKNNHDEDWKSPNLWQAHVKAAVLNVTKKLMRESRNLFKTGFTYTHLTNWLILFVL